MKLDNLITIGVLVLFVLSPLGIAFSLCSHLIFNEQDYISFVKWNDIVINAGLFIFAALYLCFKLFGNPQRDDSNDTGAHLN